LLGDVHPGESEEPRRDAEAHGPPERELARPVVAGAVAGRGRGGGGGGGHGGRHDHGARQCQGGKGSTAHGLTFNPFHGGRYRFWFPPVGGSRKFGPGEFWASMETKMPGTRGGRAALFAAATAPLGLRAVILAGDRIPTGDHPQGWEGEPWSLGGGGGAPRRSPSAGDVREAIV